MYIIYFILYVLCQLFRAATLKMIILCTDNTCRKPALLWRNSKDRRCNKCTRKMIHYMTTTQDGKIGKFGTYSRRWDRTTRSHERQRAFLVPAAASPVSPSILCCTDERRLAIQRSFTSSASVNDSISTRLSLLSTTPVRNPMMRRHSLSCHPVHNVCMPPPGQSGLAAWLEDKIEYAYDTFRTLSWIHL